MSQTKISYLLCLKDKRRILTIFLLCRVDIVFAFASSSTVCLNSCFYYPGWLWAGQEETEQQWLCWSLGDAGLPPKHTTTILKKLECLCKCLFIKNIQTIDVIMKPEQSMFILTAGNVTQWPVEAFYVWAFFFFCFGLLCCNACGIARGTRRLKKWHQLRG